MKKKTAYRHSYIQTHKRRKKNNKEDDDFAMMIKKRKLVLFLYIRKNHFYDQIKYKTRKKKK